MNKAKMGLFVGSWILLIVVVFSCGTGKKCEKSTNCWQIPGPQGCFGVGGNTTCQQMLKEQQEQSVDEDDLDGGVD